MTQDRYYAERQHGHLGKIGGDGVGEAIEKAMEREKDEEVLHEMNRGLELLAQKKRVDNISLFSYCNMGGRQNGCKNED